MVLTHKTAVLAVGVFVIQAGSDLKVPEVEIVQNLVYIAKLVYFQASFISQLQHEGYEIKEERNCTA